MGGSSKAAGAGSTAPAAAAAKSTRPEVSESVLAEAGKRGKVVMHPSAKDVEANPGARGYDENGMPRPADARAAYLVVPKAIEPTDDLTPEDQAAAVRKAGKALRAERRKAAEKAKG